MKYKVGDRVKMHSLQWCKENIFNNEDKYPPELFGGIEKFCGKILTISDAVDKSKYVDEGYYNMFEDTKWDYYWSDEMIEGLVEEEVDLIPKFGEFSDNEPLDIPTMTTDFIKEYGLPCPDGYIFKDENGNVINTTKIVLEKKKKEYPKTYYECCKVLGGVTSACWSGYKCGVLGALNKLLICRDAYWKIAGDEMGLGRPWEPDWDTKDNHFYTTYTFNGKIECAATAHRNAVLIFPTEEMRDEFYDNFKEEIKMCKELL